MFFKCRVLLLRELPEEVFLGGLETHRLVMIHVCHCLSSTDR